MKFLVTAWLAGLAASTAAAPRPPPLKLAQRQLKAVAAKGAVARRLMEKAVRVNGKIGERILDEAAQEEGEAEEQQEVEEFQISGAHSIQFSRCVSLSAEPADEDLMFDQYMISYTKAGQIVSQRSYVLFNVCAGYDCDYGGGDENLYMVDVATYLAAVTEYYAGKQESYCEACEQANNYCA
jgi:hypothetical protein